MTNHPEYGISRLQSVHDLMDFLRWFLNLVYSHAIKIYLDFLIAN